MKSSIKQFALLCLFFLGTTYTNAQGHEEGSQDYLSRTIKINDKLNKFLKENEGYKMAESEKQTFLTQLKEDGHHLTGQDEEALKLKFIEGLLKTRFIAQNPSYKEALKDPPFPFSYPSPCYKGDFESLPLTTFSGYHHIGTNNMQCNQIPLNVPADLSYVPVPMTGGEVEFTLMGIGTDPLVPASALQLTHGGSAGSLRINGPGGGQDISVLRKGFSTPTTGDQVVSFNSAIVLEAPHYNTYDPFMTVRVLNSSGAVVGGPLCITPSSADITWNPFSIGSKDYVWMDWKCFNVPYYGIMGDNYFLEISVGDCGYFVHGGYAYVDDICNKVCQPINLDCCDAAAGQVLSWSAAPGAAGYEVDFLFNDPNCCNVSEAPIGLSVSTTSNVIFPPAGYSDCFSWRVRIVYPDGTKSDWSDRQCDCSDPATGCETPINLKCEPQNNHRQLSWDAVPGALGGYEIVITYNDPTCCSSGTVTTETIYTMDEFTNVVDVSLCFSWKVRAICNSASVSGWSETICACPSFFQAPQGNTRNDEILQGLKVSIVPNPADDYILISFEGVSKDLKTQSDFVILNSAGLKVLESKVKLDEDQRVDVSMLNPGIYFYEVIHQGIIVESGKLIIN